MACHCDVLRAITVRYDANIGATVVDMIRRALYDHPCPIQDAQSAALQTETAADRERYNPATGSIRP